MQLPAQRDAIVGDVAARRRAVLEVCGATLAVGAVIFVVEKLGSAVPLLSGYGGVLVAGAFLATPVVIGRWRRVEGDVHGLGGGTIGRSIAWGLGLTLLVAGPFALGFDTLQVQVLQRARGAGPGLLDVPMQLAGRPARVRGQVGIYSDGGQVFVYNGRSEAVRVKPLCAAITSVHCAPRRLSPGAATKLVAPADTGVQIDDLDGNPLPAEALAAGAAGEPIAAQPVQLPRSGMWLLWALLTQLLVVALPEEAFFRGYVQGRLAAVMPARRRVFGVPFGAAEVLASALFAVIHLFAHPAPSRLLVFFPGLLFAWLAARNRNVIGATVHHALSNLMLQVARRFYG